MRSENNQNIEKYYNGIISNNNNANQFNQSEFNQNITNTPCSESLHNTSYRQVPSCNSYQDTNLNAQESDNVDQISMNEPEAQESQYGEQTQRKYYGANQNFYPTSIVVPRNTLIGLDCTQFCQTQYFSQVPSAYNQGAELGNAPSVYFPQQQNGQYFSNPSIDNGNQTYLAPRLKNSTGCIIQANPPTVFSPASAYPSQQQQQTNQNLQTLYNNKRNTQNENDLYAGMQNLCLDSTVGTPGSHSNQNHYTENTSGLYQTQEKTSRVYAYNPHQSSSPNQFSTYYQNQPAFYPQPAASPHQPSPFPHQIGFWNNGSHSYFDYANQQHQQRLLGYSNYPRAFSHANTNNNNNHLRNQKLTIPLTIRNNPDINPKEFDMSLLRNSRYFVIKSGCAFNVEKAMYHGIWCSTSYGNDTLDTAYCETHRIEKKPSKKDSLSQERNDSVEKTKDGQTTNNECVENNSNNSQPSDNASTNGNVLLFFSITHSRSICGVAEMIGRNDKNASSSIWSESRWKGQFPIKWIYVKQIPDTIMNHIQLPRNENKPITRVRDCTEIWPSSLAEELLQIIHKYPNQ